MAALTLTGRDLNLAGLLGAAKGNDTVALAPEGLARMRESRAVIDRAIRDRVPIYGVTTGLGARVTETLDADRLADFSLQTLRGRAHAIGTPLPREVVRATMILRANTLLLGYAGAQVDVAAHIIACLNAGLTPVVPEIGTIGVADLIPNATLGLALVGEGQMTTADGTLGPSAELMRAAGIAPLVLGPRDGLALANHASLVSALGALGLGAAEVSYHGAQSAAALSLQAFGANLGPFGAPLLSLRPLPGQMQAAKTLRGMLAGSPLWQPKAARRLQDPLSFRNIPQVHGTVDGALAALHAIVAIELNGSSDNPAVLVADQDVLSTGNYYSSELTNALEGVNRAFVHLCMAQLARIAKHLNPVFSGLPVFLARPESGSNGFAPLMKTAEAVVGQLLHAAQPAAIWPSVNANGVEDCLSGAPVAAQSLCQVATLSAQLSAIELIVAAQALDLRGLRADEVGVIGDLHRAVRSQVPPLESDRPLGADVMRLADAINGNVLWQGAA